MYTIAIIKTFMRIGGPRQFTGINYRACCLMNFQVRAYKIGMRMGFNYACYVGFIKRGKIIIGPGVAGGVDNHHFSHPYYGIRSMGQTLIVKLMNDHCVKIISSAVFRISNFEYRIAPSKLRSFHEHILKTNYKVNNLPR